MTFNETAIFPRNIAFNAHVGPEYQTTLTIVNSGFESRNADWQAARLKFDVGMRPMKKVDTDALIAFFRSVKGRAYGFRFRDWSDYQATSATGVLVAVTGGGYRLAKKYGAGSMIEIRPITKPVSGTVTIAGGGTVDYATGLVTGASPTTTWAGEFDVPCRFDTDRMELEAIDKSAGDILFQWGSIPIIEIRV
jgi:uncharacterized protein (TIGR02217 family)